MTKLKLSSKMHLFIIISVAVVFIGFLVGIICQFVAGGFFNYGAEFKSYNTDEINYAYVDFSEEEKVVEICDGVFDKAGVSYYNCASGDTSDGGKIIFRFSAGSDEKTLADAANAIQTLLNGDKESSQSYAAFHKVQTTLNGGRVLTYTSIAIASAVVLQLIYYIVRYKLTMALGALLANFHNLALYVALLAMTRIPVGLSAVAFAALTVLFTMIATGYMFDRYRRNLKKENFAKLDGDEQTDICVRESLVNSLYPAIGVAVLAVILFVMLSVSAMSVVGVISPVVLSVLAVASAIYGSMFFMPPVYTRIKRIGDAVKNRSKKNNK